MFRKVLIANRGEIAVRVIRTCQKLDIQTVAVYSDADASAVHVRTADEAHRIGPPNPLESYLNIHAIIKAVQATGAEAVHPGYGFLSENAALAEAVSDAGRVWIGPRPDVMRALASKTHARATVARAGVPVIPGTLTPVTEPLDIVEVYDDIGPPLLLKPDGGGGGKGTRRILEWEKIPEALEGASREAQAYFGRAEVYVEKELTKPRHIEVQVLADEQGRIVHLFERECSIQRRYQKLVEEAPSPALDPAGREALTALALVVVRTLGYTNAGTVEFLRDASGEFYFLEVNKRIQVEHPVTELVTGIDLVEQQLRIAAGEPLQLRQADIQLNGHAIEARVNAEDPTTFLPSPGKVMSLRFPNSAAVRVDHALEIGSTIPFYYDPLVAKVIAWGNTRDEARTRLLDALQHVEIGGIKTNVPMHRVVLAMPEFGDGRLSTTLLEEKLPELRALIRGQKPAAA
jgi:acetyl-CoA carboxylase biotin carboxylase subunit